jgi:hypothetical protein
LQLEDVDVIAELVVDTVQSALTASQADVQARLKALETPRPELAQILAVTAQLALVRAELAALKAAGASNRSDLEALVTQEVRQAIAQIPVPKDGRDGDSVSWDEMARVVAIEAQKAVQALPPAKDGEPGRSVEIAEVDALVATRVEQAMAALPVPKDVTVADLTPVIETAVAKAVAALPPAKDGIGVLGALIDRAGQLVVTLSDGTVKTLGVVVGRDVDMGEVARLINDGIAQIPAPLNGTDGRDGLGFEHLDLIVDEERGCVLCFVLGDQRKEFRLPIVLDRGVYRTGRTYGKGDGVTFGGSFWIAQDTTSEKPGDGATKWRLAVKAGREGREGKSGAPGQPGPKGDRGDPGRDYR